MFEKLFQIAGDQMYQPTQGHTYIRKSLGALNSVLSQISKPSYSSEKTSDLHVHHLNAESVSNILSSLLEMHMPYWEGGGGEGCQASSPAKRGGGGVQLLGGGVTRERIYMFVAGSYVDVLNSFY